MLGELSFREGGLKTFNKLLNQIDLLEILLPIHIYQFYLQDVATTLSFLSGTLGKFQVFD